MVSVGADRFAARVQVASGSLQELNVSGWTLRSEATAALCKLLTVLRWHTRPAGATLRARVRVCRSAALR